MDIHSICVRAELRESLGHCFFFLLFFVLPIFFRNNLGSEDEIKIKIKFIRTIFQLN